MKSKHFRIEELVDQYTFMTRGTRAWELLDPQLLSLIDRIKEKFPMGSMTINNWLWHGTRTESGLRNANSSNYSKHSQHSLGKAIDAVFSSYTAEEVRKYMLANLEEFPELRGLETGVNWLHVDVRNRDDLLKFTA